MCLYSSTEGMPTDWHFVHLGSRAVGGAGAVIMEATAISPAARITVADMGIWSDEHAEAFRPITSFIKSAGAAPGIQLAHAGLKASRDVPWHGTKHLDPSDGGWETLAPSQVTFNDAYPLPREMTFGDIQQLIEDFVKATQRAHAAGFEIVELHAAHGFLLQEFLSPFANQRTDQYGGSLENRMRLPIEVAAAVRQSWPEHLPLFMRISATDWCEAGWALQDSITLCKKLKAVGVDLIDCSSGGIGGNAVIPHHPGYQVELSAAIRREAGIATGAVGLITEPEQAERIIANGEADAVLLARAFLRDPYWPLHAADALGEEVAWPVQYGRAKLSIKK